MANRGGNIQWLDSLRTLATLGVILIHVSSPILNTTFYSNIDHWWLGNILMSATRYAVPMFLLLSGATMLGREYDLKEFYKRRLTRVVVPFLFWIIAYFFFRYFTLPTKNPPSGFTNILHWAGNLFITEGVSKHFWYIYMIIFIYMFLPFLSNITKIIDKKRMVYLLLGWMIMASWCTRYGANMYLFTDISRLFKYILFTGYLFIGFYLHNYVKCTRQIKVIAIVIFVSTIIISALTVYFTSIATNATNQRIYNYMSFNTIAQTISLFILIKDYEIKNKVLRFINKTINEHSFGIYLVHIMIIGILYNHGISWKLCNPYISTPIIFSITLVISYLVIFLLRKIPYGKYISG